MSDRFLTVMGINEHHDHENEDSDPSRHDTSFPTEEHAQARAQENRTGQVGQKRMSGNPGRHKLLEWNNRHKCGVQKMLNSEYERGNSHHVTHDYGHAVSP